MKKDLLALCAVVLIVGAVLFYDQIINIFRGMSPLEAMQTIWTFVLHIAVGTIFAYVIFGLPEIVKPWLKTMRRRWKNGPNARWKNNQQPQTNVRMPRLTAEQKFLLLLAKMNNGQRPPAQMNRTQRVEPPQESQIDFKW